MTETLVRCPRCKSLFHSLRDHFCSIPERKPQLSEDDLAKDYPADRISTHRFGE